MVDEGAASKDAEIAALRRRIVELESESASATSLDPVTKLQQVPLLVMDNSLRECTVAALRGHTIDDKWRILREIEKCGFRHIIIGALTEIHRVDDLFAQQLRDNGENMERFYAFTEVRDRDLEDGTWDEAVPVAMVKMKEYGILHPIIEVDLSFPGTDYNRFDPVARIRARLEWAAENLSNERCLSRPCVNIRDLMLTMEKAPERAEAFIRGVSAFPPSIRPFCLNTEDPSGSYLPDHLARFISKMREWWGPVSPMGPEAGGNMCVHIHKGFGLAEANVLSALGAGANGIWCAVCEVGAAVGHACSAITLTNLARFGNKYATTCYDIEEVLQAAVEVTRITTGQPPSRTTEIYGARATEHVFDFVGLGDDFLKERWGGFDLAKIANTSRVVAIHTLSTPEQIRNRLSQCFGEHDWDDEAIMKMREKVLQDLKENRKEEYQSSLAIGLLYRSVGGLLPANALEGCADRKANDETPVIKEAKAIWMQEVTSFCDGEEGCERRLSLSFRSFYDLFMARYFGCYRCDIAEHAFKIFDIDSGGCIHWREFAVWLQWAVDQYPEETQTVEDVVDVAFSRGILPDIRAMGHSMQASG